MDKEYYTIGISSFGWFLIHIQINVQNMECIKIINAQHAKSKYVYRNTKQELLKKKPLSVSVKHVK
jgi:hypothetical protein